MDYSFVNRYPKVGDKILIVEPMCFEDENGYEKDEILTVKRMHNSIAGWVEEVEERETYFILPSEYKTLRKGQKL